MPSQPPRPSLGEKLLPAVIPLLFLAVGLWLAARHTVFEEWDGGMQAFAAREIGAGLGYTGWASHFWPPLYTLLLLFLSRWMTLFAAGKLISVVSGALLLGVTYPLAREISGSRRVALAAQLLLATNQLFLNTTIQAENHLLATFLFTAAILLALIALRRQTFWWFAAWGACLGLAGLARYQNLGLLPAGLLLIIVLVRDRKALGAAAAFLVACLVISAPWLYLNYRHNGSPLATWQYLNLGLAVIPRAWGITRMQFWWDAQTHFHSLFDIFRASPRAYVLNFLSNLRATARLLWIFYGALSALGFVGALVLTRRAEPRQWLTLWLSAVCYVVMACQAFVYGVVMVPLGPLLALATVLLVRELARWFRDKRPRAPVTALAGLILAGLLAVNVIGSYGNLRDYLGHGNGTNEMLSASQVAAAMRAFDPKIADKYVMAINPGRAYHAGSRYLCLPLYLKSNNALALATYGGLSPQVLNWAPRYPFPPMVNRADYLIYDQADVTFLPQYQYLLNPTSSKIPRNFELVFQAPGVVVYAIDWQWEGLL